MERVCGFLLLLLTAPLAFAQYSEAEVKAAFIFNIAKYAEWTAAALPAGAVLRICVLGAEGGPLEVALRQHQGKQIRGHPVEVRAGLRFGAMKPCPVTVVTHGAAERLRVLNDERDTLTVSDEEGFIEQGGMIGLVMTNNRVAFEANLDAAQRGGVQLPAQLLKLARRVKG